MKRHVYIIIGLMFMARIVAMWAGWLDGELTLADDAFYYFQIARNVAAGAGATFDGLAPTNGFHPLYLLALAILYVVWPASPWIPVHAGLTLGLLCDVASGFLIYRLLRGTSERAAAIGVALWATQPLAIATSHRGMESSLSVVSLLAAVALYREWRRHPASYARAAMLGAGCGLAVLARTEHIFLTGVIVLVALCHLGRRGVRGLLVGTLVFGALVTPWLAWQWWKVGTLEQASGTATRLFNIYGNLANAASDALTLGGVLSSVALVAEWVHRCALGQEYKELNALGMLYAGASGACIVGAIAIPLWGYVVWKRTRSHDERSGSRRSRAYGLRVYRGCRSLVPLAIVAGLHLIYYFLVSRTYRPWYHMPLVAIGVLYVSVVAGSLPRRAAGAVLAASLVLHAGVFSVYMMRAARFDTSRTLDRRISWLEEHCGPTARVGLLNAGKLGYLAGFRSELKIVNLDGVVNNPLLRAYRTQTFPEYYCSMIDCAIEVPPPGMFRDVAMRREYEAFQRRTMVVNDLQPVPLYRFQCD